MNCRICGAELARDGELCNNCMNKLMAEQALRNDVEEFYSFKRKFVLGYEILRHAEQICIVIFMIVLMLSINFSYWKYALLTALVFSVFGIFYLWYFKISLNTGVCTLYHYRLVYSYGKFKRRTKEIPFSEIEEIFYNQGNMQKMFNVGTIVIKRRTRNIMDRFTYIESVKNVEQVFGKIQEVFK